MSSVSPRSWLCCLRRLARACCPAAALVLLCAAPPYTAAASETRPMRFDRLTLDDGLSQSTVITILQDSTGFMWFGTENGLNRYDGYDFRHYKRGTGSIPNDFIWDLAEDQHGNLWIGTDGGGLVRWNAASDSFTIFGHDEADPASISDDTIRAVHVDAGGSVWIGTQHGGLNRLDPTTGEITHFRHEADDPQSLSSDEIYTLYQDRNGALWIGTNGGLTRLDPASGEMRRYRHEADDPRSLSDDRVRAVLEDQRGTLWVGTSAGGLNRLDRRTGLFTRFVHSPDDPASLSHNRVRAIFEDDDLRLWVGTSRGLNLMDRKSGTFARYSNDPADAGSLVDNYVMSLYQDAGGVLWIGTKSGGLCKWNPRSWSLGHHAASENGLNNSNISSFAEDDAGLLWVGTFGGGLNAVNRINGDTFQMRHDPDDDSSLSDDRIMTLLRDRRGMLWAGTMTGGLNEVDPRTRTVRRFRHDPSDPRSLSADGVMALFEDSLGNVWVGTFGGGVSKYVPEDDHFVRYVPRADDPSSLNSLRATAFAEDRNGRIWIGTDGGGLNLHDPHTDTFYHFEHDPDDDDSISADTIFSLHLDESGVLWVGTRGGGLNRVIGSSLRVAELRFESISQTDGLSNDVIYGIRSDRRGNLWLSTNHGLTRYNPETRSAKSFHRSHGLQAEEFNFGAHYQSAGGELFFGGPNGFNAFFAEELELNTHRPPVVLTAFSAFNRPVQTEVPYSMLDEVELGYGDDVISFEFAALDFTAPEENRYAYRLEGFDDDWIELGSRRRVTYTNLDRGHYVLRVRGANSDGAWSRDGLALALRVEAAPWETWWAYMLYALALVAVVAAIWRVQQTRLAREAEYSRRLEVEVQLRTRELASSNRELQGLNDRLLEASLTDPLTGLRNRRFLFEEVSKDIDLLRRWYDDPSSENTGEPFNMVFLMVDLDHFKPVNDRCGHAAGDQVIMQVRDVLLEATRHSDFVIRWGGDEFLVVSRNSRAHEVEALAERIRSQISRKVFALGDGQVVRTTCSIGFACFPFVDTDVHLVPWEQVIGLADSALYEAKRQRNAWVGFLSTQDTPGTENLVNAIREAPRSAEQEGLIGICSSVSRAAEVVA